MSETVQVRLLGPLHVASSGSAVALSPGTARLFAYLLLGPEEGRTRAAIAAHLYDENCTNGRRRLSTMLWRLRAEMKSAVGQDVVLPGAMDVIAIDNRCRVEVDVRAFEATLEPILRKRVPDTTDDDARALAGAVADYRGNLLEGYYDDWVLEARDTYAWMHLAALTRLVHHHAGHGHLADVERYARQILSIEPLREDIHRALIAAFTAAGRPDLAERQFEACRDVLHRELGVLPMPETVAAHPRLARAVTTDRVPMSLAAAIAELEAARAEIAQLNALVTASLDRLRSVIPTDAQPHPRI